MKHRLYLLPVFIFALLALGSCHSGPIRLPKSQSDHMFEQMHQMLIKGLDSIAAAKDSAALIGAQERLEARLTRLALRYSPQTDKQLSQGQNDTLCLLTDSIVRLRRQRLARFAQPADTIDSTPDSVAL